MNGDPGDSYRIKILARAPTTASRMIVINGAFNTGKN
jgi:hypothetical protein